MFYNIHKNILVRPNISFHITLHEDNLTSTLSQPRKGDFPARIWQQLDFFVPVKDSLHADEEPRTTHPGHQTTRQNKQQQEALVLALMTKDCSWIKTTIATRCMTTNTVTIVYNEWMKQTILRWPMNLTL